MGVTAESIPPRVAGLRASNLRRPLILRHRGSRLTVDPDGTVRSLYSLPERRALFGFEQVSFYKVQAGVVVHAQRQDWGLRASPRSIQLAGRAFEGVELSQSLEFHRGPSLGYLRKVRLRNGTQGPMRLRVLDIQDPTASHFSSDLWGSLGVNAFNRESHVAMDEVSDPPSARVVGSSPSPSKFFMTTMASRAMDSLSSGELPEGTAGMSGQVVLVASHEVELSAGESRDLTFASIYSPVNLEDALAEFGRLQSGSLPTAPLPPLLASSDRDVSEAAAWAIQGAVEGPFSPDLLDRCETLPLVTRADPRLAIDFIQRAKSAVRKDGALPHSLDQSKPGPLETSLFLRGLALHLLASQDKKLARAYHPLVKKLGRYLASSNDPVLVSDPSLPQGWRRLLGSGYPTGEVPEVSLAAAAALLSASHLCRFLGKTEDAARFRERAEMMTDRVRKKLVDERGFLALCRDSSGRLKSDDTADMAVAAYRHPLGSATGQAAAHRLLEKDFDTPYGPRCVPTTNQVYFNSSYGMGQLGGVWPRAVLAHALVCYGSGLPGVGSLSLGKVARLVGDEATRLGGSPGEFPLWVDPDGRTTHGAGGDPVASARFLEALLEGELGMSVGTDGASFAPAESSALSWVLACDFWAGERFSAFLGRGGGRTLLLTAGGKVGPRQGGRFSKSEQIDISARGVYCASFYSPGQVLCLGNSTPAPVRATVSFTPRAVDLSKHLTVPLEVYDPAKEGWTKTGSLRVSPTMTIDAPLDANGWKVYRVSTA